MTQLDAKNKTMLDIDGRKVKVGVQIQTAFNAGGVYLWVNVDGICRLRICHISPKKFEQDLVSL